RRLPASEEDGAVRHPRHGRGGLCRRRGRDHARRPGPSPRNAGSAAADAGRSVRHRVHSRAAFPSRPGAGVRRGRRVPAPPLALVLAVGLGCAVVPPARAATTVSIGSKAFPESWILGEALAGALRGEGLTVMHRSNLGGTEIVFQALRSGGIDVYAEYTGTILEVILHSGRRMPLAELRDSLAVQGLGVSDPIGFNDGYAIAVSQAVAERETLRTLSDLLRHP